MAFDTGVSEWENPAGFEPAIPLKREANAGN